MPTPIGHAVAGLATAWFAESTGPKMSWARPLALACAGVAMLPDFDLLLGNHRMYTHSISAVFAVGIIAYVALRRRTPWAIRIAVTIAAAYGSHILLDWLGKDSSNPAGMMALWPFSSAFYVSGLDIFMEVSRRYWRLDEFIGGNFKVLGWELLILGPVAVIARAVRYLKLKTGN